MEFALQGNGRFNDGDFPGAKSELDIAIAYNWKVGAANNEKVRNWFSQPPSFFTLWCVEIRA